MKNLQVNDINSAVKLENKLQMLQDRKQVAAQSFLSTSLRTVARIEQEIETIDSALVEFYNSLRTPASR